MPATTTKTSPATSTTTKAASPTKKETSVPFEDAELLPEHWSVQACKAEDLRADRDGVALASKATYLAKKSILEGSPNRIAMLLPPTTETEVEAPLVTVFAKINNETKQTTRKFVQLGSEPVKYEPPTSRGPTLRIESMRTIVLEIIKGTFDEKQWKEQAINADSTFLQYIKPILEGTRWANARPSRCRPSIYDGKTTSMQSFVRIPDACVSACLKRSGMGDDRVYARVFTERGPEEPRAHVNIWLNDRNLEEARMAVQALPDTDFFGLYANHRGFAARILEADAPQYAPLLNGRPYASGDKYVIQGVPRDCAWESLFEAITAMDNPWENFDQARLVYRKAGAWTVQVKSPPPSPIIFLGDLVLSAAKSESNRSTARKPTRPTPTATAWNAPPACPALREAARSPKVATRCGLDDDEDMDLKDESGKAANPKEMKKARTASPIREAAPASSAVAAPSAPSVAAASAGPEARPAGQDEATARMEAMQAQMMAMMQQMMDMQNARMDAMEERHAKQMADVQNAMQLLTTSPKVDGPAL